MPRRKNTTFMPVSSRAKDAKPSADISSRNPKWAVRKPAEAATSSTFSDTAEAVIFTLAPYVLRRHLYNVLRTEYNVQHVEVFPIPSARTGAGNPARTLRLLWRDPVATPRHGPRQGLTVDQIVTAATALADADGMD